MRTIKFRGQKISNGVWVKGSLVSSETLNTAIYYQVGNGSIKQMEWVYVNPDTVGQFTGIYDKFGTAIYEGDIVRTSKYVTSVIYHEAGFRLQVIENKKITPLFMRGELEVIGNIYGYESVD